MDLSSVDWNTCLDQLLSCWNEAVHWMLNDGSSLSIFLGIVFACSLMVALGASGKNKQLVQNRSSYDVECFVRDMTRAGYDGSIARIVYHYIQGVCRVDFPIMPGDDLYTMLGITQEKLQRSMPALMGIAGRQERPMMRRRIRKPLHTIDELIGFVENLPTVQEQVWELQTA